MTRLVILCLSWMVLSAATAYYADIWGRKLGKQRKTLWRLRPKHTAVAIITISGAVIAGLSFAILLIANAGIRKALLHWDQTVADNRALTAQKEQLTNETQQLQEKNQAAKRDIVATQAQLRDARAGIAEAQKTVKSVRGELAGKQTELVGAKGQLRDVTSDLDRISGKLGATNRELNTKTRALSERRVQLQNAEHQLTNATRSTFQVTTKMLALENNALKLQQTADLALAGKLLVRGHEELVRATVPAGLTTVQAREKLASIVNQARIVLQNRAHDKGFGFPAGKDYVQLPVRYLRLKANGPVMKVSALDVLAAQLSAAGERAGWGEGRPYGTVVCVVSTEPVVAGSSVPIEFEPYKNHLVFKKGTEITRITITQDESKEQVWNDIWSGMQDVRSMALRNGLMPSEDNSVTSLTGLQMADIYNTVLDMLRNKHKSEVPVRFIAAEDTFTAGPLRLKLEVVG